MNNLYLYRFKLDRVIDGDTVYGTVDCGFGIAFYIKVRLNGINAPEKRGASREQGIISKNAMVRLLDGHELFIRTVKDRTGKYGRYIGDIFIAANLERDYSVNTQMVDEGYAVVY